MAHRGSRGIALLFHDHSTRRGWGSVSCPDCSLALGKTHSLCRHIRRCWQRELSDIDPDYQSRRFWLLRKKINKCFVSVPLLCCKPSVLLSALFWDFTVKVKCTLVQALRLCTGRTAHRGSRGIALLFHDHSTRRGWGSVSRPGHSLPLGKTRCPLYREAGWAPGPVWTGAENLAPTGIWSPDRPAHSQSLYRPNYPAHQFEFNLLAPEYYI